LPAGQPAAPRGVALSMVIHVSVNSNFLLLVLAAVTADLS
jgi:hypothetical protein